MLQVMVSKRKTNPLIFSVSWHMEAVQAAVRKILGAIKSHSIPSLLTFTLAPFPRETGAVLAGSPSPGSLRPRGHFIKIQISFTTPFFFLLSPSLSARGSNTVEGSIFLLYSADFKKSWLMCPWALENKTAPQDG